MSAPEDTGLVHIAADGVTLLGNLRLAKDSRSVVVFVHSNEADRHSPGDEYVAAHLRELGFATLLFDLLTAEEAKEAEDPAAREERVGVDLRTRRLAAVTDWLLKAAGSATLRAGYYASGTGAAAALAAAVQRAETVRAIVSCSGRPDLAAQALEAVTAPTMLLVGSEEPEMIAKNRDALHRLGCDKRLQLVADAADLTDEPDALDQLADLAGQWFRRFLP
jgi:hypothetical protein